METISLTSRNGLNVTIPQAEYDQILAVSGTPIRARERILSDAGRALKHRRILADFHAQILTDEQREQVENLARSLIRQDAIYAAAFDLGYGQYVNRVIAGRPVNDGQWARIVERAAAWAGEIDDSPTDGARNLAMYYLGLLTADGADYSRRFTELTWSISAPDGWDGKPANHPTAIK